jgi:hypothetical protein
VAPGCDRPSRCSGGRCEGRALPGLVDGDERWLAWPGEGPERLHRMSQSTGRAPGHRRLGARSQGTAVPVALRCRGAALWSGPRDPETPGSRVSYRPYHPLSRKKFRKDSGQFRASAVLGTLPGLAGQGGQGGPPAGPPGGGGRLPPRSRVSSGGEGIVACPARGVKKNRKPTESHGFPPVWPGSAPAPRQAGPPGTWTPGRAPLGPPRTPPSGPVQEHYLGVMSGVSFGCSSSPPSSRS